MVAISRMSGERGSVPVPGELATVHAVGRSRDRTEVAIAKALRQVARCTQYAYVLRKEIAARLRMHHGGPAVGLA
jgi:hypothetical protein